MSGEQAASDIVVAFKREGTPGVAAGDTSGTRIRVTGGAGMEKVRTLVPSNEKRADGNKGKGRHSAIEVAGEYEVDLTAGGALDIVIEAITRAAWAATTTDGFVAVFTSIAISSNVLTATGGSFISEGYRVGQVVFFTGMEDSENSNVNCLVVGVTASTLTVEPAQGVALTDNAADTTGTINRLGTVFQGAAPTKYHHTIEQREQGNDLGEQFLGCKLVGFSLNIQPKAAITCTLRFMGFDSLDLTSGTTPYFTTPALTTGLALVGDEITLRYNGVVETIMTGITLNFDLDAAGKAVLGSLVTADIYDNDFTISGTGTKIRDDHANIILFDAETEFEIMILMEDRSSSAPFDCFGLYLPIVTVDKITAPFGSGDGPMTETMTFGFGTKVAATGYEATSVQWSSSAQA